jgi:hypothetical protein
VAPRLDIHETAKGARAKKDADRDFLGRLSDRQAAMVMGSRAKADLVLGGLDATDVFNAGTDPLYQVRPLEEAIKKHGMVVPKPSRPKAAPKPKAAPTAPPPTAKRKTLDEFIELGTERLLELPSPARDPRAFFAELSNQLERAVGISQVCKVSGTNKAVALVKDASRRFPNSWTAKSDSYANTLKAEVVNHRACYDPLRCRISTRDFFKPTLHEFTHHLQTVMPELDDYFQELHRRRTAGQPLEEMADLLPHDGYPRGEVTRKDNYARAYQGREYEWSKGREALEVMPMAFQAVLGYTPETGLAAGAELHGMYNQDREMVELVLGLLFGWTP